MRDLTGEKFNGWTVLAKSDKKDKYKQYYWCQCDCGTIRQQREDDLVYGYRKRCWECTPAFYRHGGTNTRLHEWWTRTRHATKVKTGRIQFCEEWQDFSKLREWVYRNGWYEGAKIARKDDTKDYSPDNCYIMAVRPKKEPKFTKEDERIVRRYIHVMTVEEIADILEKPVESVRKHIELNRYRKRKKRWYPDEEELLRKYYPVMTNKELQSLLDKSEQAILKKAGVMGLYPEKHAQKYGMTAVQAREAYVRRKQGERVENIALDFGLPVGRVTALLATKNHRLRRYMESD